MIDENILDITKKISEDTVLFYEKSDLKNSIMEHVENNHLYLEDINNIIEEYKKQMQQLKTENKIESIEDLKETQKLESIKSFYEKLGEPDEEGNKYEAKRVEKILVHPWTKRKGADAIFHYEQYLSYVGNNGDKSKERYYIPADNLKETLENIKIDKTKQLAIQKMTNKYEEFITKLQSPIVKGYHNINNFREKITNQNLYYHMGDPNKGAFIYELPNNKFQDAFLDSFTFFSKPSMEVIDQLKFTDAKAKFNIDKMQLFIEEKKELSELNVRIRNLKTNKSKNEILEIVSLLENYINKSSITDKRIENIIAEMDSFKDIKTKTAYLGANSSTKLSSLAFYKGGDAARKNTSGGYDIIQDKMFSGTVSFNSTKRAMDWIEKVFYGNKKWNKQKMQDKLKELFTFDSSQLPTSILKSANDNAKANINKYINEMFKQEGVSVMVTSFDN